jgi:hypothetical protein
MLVQEKKNHPMKIIPAVVVPSFLNTGFSFARSDNVAFGRIPSSTEIVTGFSSPVLGSTIYLKKLEISAQQKPYMHLHKNACANKFS